MRAFFFSAIIHKVLNRLVWSWTTLALALHKLQKERLLAGSLRLGSLGSLPSRPVCGKMNFPVVQDTNPDEDHDDEGEQGQLGH